MSALISPNSISYLGIDSTNDLTNYANQLQAAGVGFVIRWYAPAGSTCTGLTVKEAQALSAAGISIITAWFVPEKSPADYYTQQQGYADGLAAYQSAQALKQPQGTAIFFPVYFNPTTADQLTSIVQAYFTGVQAALSPGGSIMYTIGVYGNDAVCYSFLPHPELSTWLEQSSSLSPNAANYTIIQSSWQLCYPGAAPTDPPLIACNANTSPNILADAFTLAQSDTD